MSDRPRAVVVVTGSEIARGDLRDANGPYLAAELLRLGAEPARIVIVGDRPDELEAAIREGLESDLCVLSGGLGPTHDDRTVEILARATGRRLRVHAGLEREIEAVSRTIADRLGRPYADFASGVTKQASMPEGAISLGLAGTAPGVLLDLGGRIAIALPGPPPELRRLWQEALHAPGVQRVLGRAGKRDRRILRFFGPGESAVARELETAGGEGGGVEVTVCARDLEIRVDLFVDDGAGVRANALDSALRASFGSQLFAEDERPVEELVLALARARALTLGTAESCTGGMVGARLTTVPGSSDVYLGGIVAYADGVKERQLGVASEMLARHGAVSAETAAAMAAGIRRALGVDVGASVTGVAGPGGGTPDKPVGLVFTHVQSAATDGGVRLQLPGDRDAVRTRAAAMVLHQLRHALASGGDDLG